MHVNEDAVIITTHNAEDTFTFCLLGGAGSDGGCNHQDAIAVYPSNCTIPASCIPNVSSILAEVWVSCVRLDMAL